MLQRRLIAVQPTIAKKVKSQHLQLYVTLYNPVLLKFSKCLTISLRMKICISIPWDNAMAVGGRSQFKKLQFALVLFQNGCKIYLFILWFYFIKFTVYDNLELCKTIYYRLTLNWHNSLNIINKWVLSIVLAKAFNCLSLSWS